MLGLPKSTEFNRRIPKQKFYENLTVSPALKRIFVEQIKVIWWRNKIAVTTMNLAAGDAVMEIEVFEICLAAPQLDEAVLRQIAGETLSGRGETLKESVECDRRRKELQKQIAALQVKVRREKQLNKQVQLNAELKRLKKALEDCRK